MMGRIRIMAGDFAPQVPLKVGEVIHWDGRIALVPEIGEDGWYEKAGTCSLFIPHGSKIKACHVAHHLRGISVF
jgi:hypothetical protein